MKIKHIYIKFFLVFLFCTTFGQIVYGVDLQFIKSFGTPGFEEDQFVDPYRISITSDKTLLIVDKKPSLQFFNLEGGFISSWDLSETFDIKDQLTIQPDREGNILFISQNEKKVYKYSFERKLLSDLSHPSFSWLESFDITFDNKIYLADNNKLMILKPEGEMAETFDKLNLWQPMDLCIGPDGNIYIADSNNAVVKIVSPSGNLIKSLSGLSESKFVRPIALSFDKKGNLFVLDSDVFGDNTTHAFIKIFSTTGELLNSIQLFQHDEKFPFFYPVDFIIFEDKLYLVDKGEFSIKVYQIIYADNE